MNKPVTSNYKKILIKIGSRVLFNSDFQFRLEAITHIVEQISELVKNGYQIILVSSGAVMSGKEIVKDSSIEKSGMAAIGQIVNISNYFNIFAKHNIAIGQILLNKSDFKNSYEIKKTLSSMLGQGILPILNQNDPCLNKNDDFVDNDELSLAVAELLKIDLVVFLTDVDGLLTIPPPEIGGELIKDVFPNDPNVTSFINTKNLGGMNSKVTTSLQLAKTGIAAYITRGLKQEVLLEAINHGNFIGTFFHPH